MYLDCSTERAQLRNSRCSMLAAMSCRPSKDTTKGLVPLAEQQGKFIAYATAPGRALKAVALGKAGNCLALAFFAVLIGTDVAGRARPQVCDRRRACFGGPNHGAPLRPGRSEPFRAAPSNSRFNEGTVGAH